MEVDISKYILNWVAIQLIENKALDAELDWEGIVSFEDGSVILHRSSYQKDLRNILL